MLLLFDAAVFAAMKPTAYYISAGRGQTVDETALIAALRERRIAGAGLDVFQTEPLPADSPFWDLPNVFITPHLGGYTSEYEDLIMPLIVEQYARISSPAGRARCRISSRAEAGCAFWRPVSCADAPAFTANGAAYSGGVPLAARTSPAR